MDNARFLNIAQGSLEECRYYLILAPQLDYVATIEAQQFAANLDEVARLLHAYRNTVLKRQKSPAKTS